MFVSYLNAYFDANTEYTAILESNPDFVTNHHNKVVKAEKALRRAERELEDHINHMIQQGVEKAIREAKHD